jgi:hypothetical protein
MDSDTLSQLKRLCLCSFCSYMCKHVTSLYMFFCPMAMSICTRPQAYIYKVWHCICFPSLLIRPTFQRKINNRCGGLTERLH